MTAYVDSRPFGGYFTHHVLVPCSILTTLKLPGMRAGVGKIYAAREEEAVAIASGLHLGGSWPLLAFQNSGLANSFNTIGSLAVSYRIPLCLLITMRGGPNDANATQIPIGRATTSMLDALGTNYTVIGDQDHVAAATLEAQRSAAETSEPHFVLFGGATHD